MEILVIAVVVGLAAGYVGLTFYRQFTGQAGCSSGCSCSAEMKQRCESDHSSMNNLTFK